MPASASPVSSTATAIAPDGIAIHTFATPVAAFVNVAEGRIPPGRYGIHRHLSLEQYTYVLTGRVSVISGAATHDAVIATELVAGDLLLTLPGESLQFVNDGTETARVLFICAPPYPPDDADTRTLAAHAPMDRQEAAAAVARLEALRAAFNTTIEARTAALDHGNQARDQEG